MGRTIGRADRGRGASDRARALYRRLGVPPGTLHAAILRSPHAHAEIRAIHTEAARRAPGVAAVITGAEVTQLSASPCGRREGADRMLADCNRPRALCRRAGRGRRRADRYLAEDALELIEVDYAPLPAIVDPLAALDPKLPPLHEGLGSNVASDRSFRYGDPERAFADAARRVSVSIRYPRNSCTPIETYGIVAEYDPGEDAYDVLANFQGPFSLHPVMARALKVPGNRLRLRTPPRFRRQLWHQTGRVPVCGADGRCRASCWPASEMGRRSARASLRIGVGDQSRDATRSGGRR